MYRWTIRKVGREKGHQEKLDLGNPAVRLWLKSGWIVPVDVVPADVPKQTRKQTDKPPVHRALHTGDFPTK